MSSSEAPLKTNEINKNTTIEASKTFQENYALPVSPNSTKKKTHSEHTN